jgi:hypothetical protein
MPRQVETRTLDDVVESIAAMYAAEPSLFFVLGPKLTTLSHEEGEVMGRGAELRGCEL